MNATDFLKKRNIIKEDKTDLKIKFEDGTEISLIELLDDYHSEQMIVIKRN